SPSLEPDPLPQATSAKATPKAATADATAFGGTVPTTARAAEDSAKTAAESTAIVAPGGAFVFPETHSPMVPSSAVSKTVPARHGTRRLLQIRTVAAGVTIR